MTLNLDELFAIQMGKSGHYVQKVLSVLANI